MVHNPGFLKLVSEAKARVKEIDVEGYKKAHAAGVAFVEQTCLERLEEPVDAVITSCAGYPLDLTFYQCVSDPSGRL